MDTKLQENVMLVAPSVTTKLDFLGNDIFIASPWVMDSSKSHSFVDGVISFHNTKEQDSYVSGIIIEVINLGAMQGRNRVAFVFKKTNKTIKPSRIRKKFMNTISETREQVRY